MHVHCAMIYGMASRKKSCSSFGLCPNNLPPSPQFGQLVQLFLNAKNVDLGNIQNDSLSKILLKERQITCFVGHVYNLKKLFKVQIIGIMEEIDSFS